MKKILKRILISAVVLLALFALFLAAWVFLIFPNFIAGEGGTAEVRPGIVEKAGKSEKIDFNQSNGVVYVNNEILVFVRESASQEKIAALLDGLDAEIDDSMADIYLYRLIFKEPMSYDDLDALARKISADPSVEKAYLNTVTELEADATGEGDAAGSGEDFEYREAAYPDDPWDGVQWNVRVPRDDNWGMEAINAPGAWGYLDQMGTVKIGLIDTLPADHDDLSFANKSCLFVDAATGKISVKEKDERLVDDHGTHVSGIMGAGWDNGTGVSGVTGGKGELYYSAVYYESGGEIEGMYATAYSYLLALKTLIDQDVQVINISQNTSRLVGFAASHGNQNAINYLSFQADMTEKGLERIISARAGEPDFVICVAAGNSNSTYYYKDDKQPYGYREEISVWEEIKYLFGWRGEKGGSLALYNNFLNLMDAEDVKGRVIVVGALGIDGSASTSDSTRYTYADFSNVGSRVDISAPGVDVYSCVVGGYDYLSGTSMAAPHVSGVAGLVFACNPDLLGPQVKDILKASAAGRYYYGSEYSGMADAEASVVNALKTVGTPVEKVLKTEVDNGLDLCFIVDTTGSMGDDIENAKENMESILEHLGEKTENYRVALIDYRDYPSRSGASRDYPYKVQLHFTNSNDSITEAINGLDLGNGGDEKETVYSALMSAVDLDWRSDAKKVIIIMGDAAPLDPEPDSGFTYDDVLLALFNADINIDFEDSDERVVDSLDTSLINVFSIGTDASTDAADFFQKISESTGGSYAGVDNASEVGDAIISSIEQIEVVDRKTVNADFGDELAGQTIHLYLGSEYLFSFETDEHGRFEIDSIETETYRWTSNSLYAGGSLDVGTDGRNAEIRRTKTYWISPLLILWEQNTGLICAALIVYLAVCIAVPVSIKNIHRKLGRRKTAVVSTSPRCPGCGFEISQGERFCRKCGCKLQDGPEETSG